MNTAGTKRINDPEVRRRQILEEAMKLFYEKGYDNTSLDDIATSLDITKGLCYRYFSSKQALLDEVISEYTQECCADFIPILQDTTLSMSERLTHILTLLFHPAKNGSHHDFFHVGGSDYRGSQRAHQYYKLGKASGLGADSDTLRSFPS